MQATTKTAPKKKEQLQHEPLTEKGGLIETQQYDDIYVRANFDDSGVYPRAGSLSHSPDIIPQGENPVADPYKYFITDNWQNDLGQNTYSNQANYVYMRGQNLSTSPRDGKLYLYWTRASLILWPQDPLDPNKGWKHQGIPTSSGATYCPVKAKKGGDKVVTTDPFYWVPESIGSDDHYCLIGRVETEENPNPIPDVNNLPDFAGYIAQHPNMCWRNVVTINPNSYTTTAIIRYDQGETTEDVNILIRCTGAPVGSEVSFSCGTSGPTPPIKLEKTGVTSEDTFSAGGYFTIPANFSSNISYTYYSNGKHPSKPMKIEIIAIYAVDATHELYGIAAPLNELGVPEHLIEEIQRRRNADPAIGPVLGLKLGSHQMETADKSTQKANLNSEDVLTDAYMKVNSFRWLEEHDSIFGNTYTDKIVKVETDHSKSYAAEKLLFTASNGNATEATIQSGVEFYTGKDTGNFNIQIKTTNIPKGCEIAFSGGTKEYPINLEKTLVSNFPVFSAGTFVDLPADLLTSIDFSLWQNGQQLPKDTECMIELKAVLLEGDGKGGGPIHGKITGSVTAVL